MTAKTKWEKDSCWGAGALVRLMRQSDQHACQACGAEAVTAGRVEYTDSASPDGRHYGDVTFLCRSCHPAHDRDVDQTTPIPGRSVLLTYCTTTGSVIPRVVTNDEVPEWTAPGFWYLPADLPPIKAMPQPWIDAASEEHGYLTRPHR